jgi:hypothetical protein
MGRAVMLVACLFPAVVLGAPAPGPSARLLREIEAEAKAAAEADQAADRLDRDILSAPLGEKDAMRLRHCRSMRVVAERHTHLVDLLWSLKERTSAQEELAVRATFKAAEAWIVAGEKGAHLRALRLCDDLLGRTTVPSTRAQTLALSIDLQGCRGQFHDIPPRISLLKKALPHLSPAERERWEAWIRDWEEVLRKNR